MEASARTAFSLRRPAVASGLFVAAALALALLYDYPRVAGYGPVSLHYWRQSDGASIALSYYENGMRFFEPQMHHAAGGDHHAVGEFPVLYYAIAALYHLFGPEDAVFRIVNFLILLTGLYLFFRVLLDLYENTWMALFPPLLLLTSPLIAFYGFNFLPNTTALGTLLMAVYAYYRFVQTQRAGWYYLAVGAALLTGLLKVSMLIPALAWGGAAVLCKLFDRRRWAAWFPSWGPLLGGGLLVLGAVAAWYGWAGRYNAAHNASHMFLISPTPIWDMDPDYRRWTTEHLTLEQYRMYFTATTLKVLAVLGGVLLLLPCRVPLPVYLLLLFTAIGSACFLVLFYNQLAIHHYYIIDLLPLPLLIVSLSLWMVHRYFPGWKRRALLYFPLLFLLATNAGAADQQMEAYYEPGGEYIPPRFVTLNKRGELGAFLQAHGIHYPEQAVVVPEISPNVALYYLNLRGWNVGTKVDDAAIRQFAEWGAQYLVILKPEYLDEVDFDWATARPIGVFDEQLLFYDISLPE